MYTHLVLTPGFAETAKAYSIILEYDLTPCSEDEAVELECNTSLALIRKLALNMLDAYNKRYSRNLRLIKSDCCNRTLEDFPAAKFCAVCGTQLKPKAIIIDDFLEMMVEIFDAPEEQWHSYGCDTDFHSVTFKEAIEAYNDLTLVEIKSNAEKVLAASIFDKLQLNSSQLNLLLRNVDKSDLSWLKDFKKRYSTTTNQKTTKAGKTKRVSK